MTDGTDSSGRAAQDPEAWLRNFQAQAEAMQRQAAEAEARLAANEVTVENRLIRMTLASGSQIKELVFLPDAGRSTAPQLTAAFRELYAKGGAKVARETLAVLSELTGEDDPSLNLARRQIPADVQAVMADEDAEAGR
jgi:DNA-binding protein YbaB